MALWLFLSADPDCLYYQCCDRTAAPPVPPGKRVDCTNVVCYSCQGMNFFQKLETAATAAELRFLIIGGLAVSFHGVARETADVDLLVCKDDLIRWREVLTGMGYSIVQQSSAFAQFESTHSTAWPVDLMSVAKDTFDSMHSAATQTEMQGVSVSMPSLNHLLALKLHALSFSHAGRFLKDYLDVENLLRVNHIDVNSTELKSLVLKYGNEEIYAKLQSTLGKS